MAALNEEDEEFYNLYRYNPVIQNVYFIEYNLDLPEFKKWYPANVKKALNDNEISSAMTMISLQTLSKLILKELVKWNKSDRFILKIDSALLKGTKKFNDLQKMLNNNYLKQAIYLLIDYEDYINYQSRVRELKEMGYRYLIEVLKPDLTNINISPKDTVYIAKDIIENNRESINSLIENGIMVVEKNNMFTYTESEILTKNKEELS